MQHWNCEIKIVLKRTKTTKSCNLNLNLKISYLKYSKIYFNKLRKAEIFSFSQTAVKKKLFFIYI